MDDFFSEELGKCRLFRRHPKEWFLRLIRPLYRINGRNLVMRFRILAAATLAVLISAPAFAGSISFNAMANGPTPSPLLFPEAIFISASGEFFVIDGAEKSLCAFNAPEFNCEVDMEVQFTNPVNNLSFVSRGFDAGDSTLASVFDSGNNLLGTFLITTNTTIVFNFAGISRLVLDDSSTGAGYSYHFFQWEDTAVVPEPASLALLGAGLAGLVVAVRRRRRS